MSNTPSGGRELEHFTTFEAYRPNFIVRIRARTNSSVRPNMFGEQFGKVKNVRPNNFPRKSEKITQPRYII